MAGTKKTLLASLLIFSIWLPQRAVHAAASFDSLSFKPATDQGYYLTVEQSQTLGQWGYAVGLMTEFSNDSVIASTATGARIRDVIEFQVANQLGGAVGLFDWLNAGLLVSFVPYHQFNAVTTGISDNGGKMGDIRLNFKGRILNNEKYPVGIALVPFVTFPTGSDSHFVGNGKVTGGAMLVVDSPRVFSERFSAALNIGAQIRSGAALSSGTSLDDQFLIGAGVNYEVTEDVQLIAEVNGWTPLENFWKNNVRNLEGNGAVRYFPIPGLALTAGGGTGILDAIGAPDWRVFVGVGYRKPREEIREEVIRTNKIHFEFDKARILPVSYPILDSIANTIKSRPEILHVRIEGHTDSKGSDAYNQRLSERRAQSVREYMKKRGIPADKMSFVGRGESQPIAPNQINGKDNPEGRALNRRVEFHLQLSPRARIKVIKEKEAPTFIEGQQR